MGKFFPAALNVAAKLCDLCKSAAALLFCRPDSAFMCIACDAKAHNTAAAAEHERVWMCEVCEQAPAAVTCKADAAALCAACDRDIHSANPLAGRHDRVPVVPFHHTAEAAVIKSTAAAVSGGYSSTHHLFADKLETAENGYIPDPWIPMSPINMVTKQYPADNTELKSMELLFQDSDAFLNFDHNYQISSQPFADGVVPDQPAIKPPAHVPAHDFSSGNRFIIDFSGSNINSHTTSLSHSVSSSSMDVGVVPDGSETSYPFGRSMNPAGSQAVGLDREARVLRYKEKRKNRKFEKTIRYASRKAYAETRPRIKGRFAKRTDPEPDIHRVFGAGAAGYVVPTF